MSFASDYDHDDLVRMARQLYAKANGALETCDPISVEDTTLWFRAEDLREHLEDYLEARSALSRAAGLLEKRLKRDRTDMGLVGCPPASP